MRANRLLGAQLVEHNLVKIEELESANERLLELIATDNPRQSTVLGILAYEKKVLKEDDVLSHLTESEGIGLIDLRDYDVQEELKTHVDLGSCWATWSVPFDKEEDFNFIATAYYLSPAVRTFWEKQFSGPVIWFGTTLENIADYLEKLEAERQSSSAVATAAAITAAATGSRPPMSTGSRPPTPTGSRPATPPSPAR